jgi:hypothetical protein
MPDYSKVPGTGLVLALQEDVDKLADAVVKIAHHLQSKGHIPDPLIVEFKDSAGNPHQVQVSTQHVPVSRDSPIATTPSGLAGKVC